MQLRDYQNALVREVWGALSADLATVLQLPTAGGKTQIATEIMRRANSIGQTVWFVCHRREIIAQASSALSGLGLKHGVIQARVGPDYKAAVQVCSVDTLRNRFDRYPAPDLIVWDECHHVVAKSWSTLKGRFPKARHLGLTATPVRLDDLPLSSEFEKLICGPGPKELTEAGYLSKYRAFAPIIPDLRGVSLRDKDYDPAKLSDAMSKPTLVGDVVDHYRRITPNARAVVFAVSIAASRAIVDRFNEAGIPATHVDGDTPIDQRSDAIADLEAGRIKVLSNVEVFTEGFDLPAIDAVILLRPTKSLALYLQMIGRGLRTAEGKAETIILDHSGLIFEHGMPDAQIEWSLDGEVKRIADAAGDSRLRRCPECKALHVWAAECPSCDYTYQTTHRTIEEIYGELREISGPPDGYETLSAFARRMGNPVGTVQMWVRRGLPLSGRFINIEQGIEWTSKNTRPKPPKGYETRAAFARRMGVTPGSIPYWINRGLPILKDSFIDVRAGQAWVRKNVKSKPSDGFESLSDFAKRVGVSGGAVGLWVRRGLPVDDNGFVDIEASKSWLAKSPPRKIRSSGPNPPTGFESKSAFARRVGANTGSMNSWERRGLPCDARGLVEIERGLVWVSENIKRKPLEGFETKTNFAKRVGVDKSVPADWVKRGLPCNAEGFIEIEAALRWVAENVPGKPPQGFEGQSAFARRVSVTSTAVRQWIKRGLPCNVHAHVNIEDGLRWVAENTRSRRADASAENYSSSWFDADLIR